MKPSLHSKPAPGAATRVISSRPPTAEERRRAQRVLLRVKVNVQIVGKPQQVQAMTHTVSESGAMLVCPDPISEGTKLLIENPRAQKSVEARVVRPPQVTHEGALVPVEFLSPSPNFWGVFFPPSIN